MAYFLDRIDPDHSHSVRWSNQLKSLGGLHPQFEGNRKDLSYSVIGCRDALKTFL